MKKSTNIDKLYPVLSIITIIFLWQIIVDLNNIPKYILPSPKDIALALKDDFNLIMTHTKVTLYESFVGFIFSIILAFLLAILMDSFTIIKKSFYPLLVISQTIPTIAIAPIFIIWFGFGTLPKIIMVIMACFFPIVISLVDGLEKIDNDYLRLFKTMNASKLQTFYHLKLPYAIVHLLSGIKIAATYMIMTAVVSEWLGGEGGIGVYMVRAKNAYALDKVFASILVIMVVSILTIYIIDFLGNKLIHWKTKKKGV
ncbi:MAG: ABC transporter permease [Clostridiaceae bacterium]|uniref:ABC transporter permease n=1 Tax=Anaerosalibacter bizertensis TaxID=932217 RepID=UPI001D013EF5|nr:ABC transporter permease [Anaerosalibacter bizertensis]MBW4829442.1 ABC transporter permease [Clostridiaceae bacterium]MBW4859446.1 ABC transporter permease [Clostridiaceae bacterium]MBW4867291.1 ABC transporter permease [Clostridiaceae bacterium]MCB5558561.1 ABC transporter permease [Anaerosalibacter bizertensis]MCG4584984.1 ABC transporter permease [Anaerosalibacter bizertensis]